MASEGSGRVVDSEIVVRGTGQVRVLPDRASLRVEVDGDGGSRDEAYQQAAPLASAVDRVLEAHAERLARVVTAALAVQPKTRWRRGESVRTGWRASRVTLLDVTDFARLGDLFAELAAAGGAVQGPTWTIEPTNPAQDEARRLAAADARRRADAYADALGLRITGVAWVSEPGLRPGTNGGGPPMMRAMAMPAGAAESMADEVIDVSPEEMLLDTTVEASFTYTTP
jgi:uncharacterized protein